MAGTLSTVSIISFIAGGIFLVVVLVLWFKLHIRDVIGDLSGRNAKKSVRQLQLENEGKKNYIMSQSKKKVVKKRGQESKKKAPSVVNYSKDQTKIVEKEVIHNGGNVVMDSGKTESLSDVQETGVMEDDARTTLLEQDENTSILDMSGQTERLVEEEVEKKYDNFDKVSQESEILIIDDIEFVSSKQVI